MFQVLYFAITRIWPDVGWYNVSRRFCVLFNPCNVTSFEKIGLGTDLGELNRDSDYLIYLIFSK